MKPTLSQFNKTRGFSLVELMVALTIGLIILAAVSSLFVTSRATYTTQDSLSRLQENARFAVHFLIKDLRRAGYYGCVSQITPESINNTLNNSSTFDYNAQIALEGVENATGPWYPSGTATLPAAILPGTDALAIRMADADSQIYLDAEMPNESAELKVNSISGLAEGDIIMVSDCASADIMQLTGIQTSSIHLQHNAGSTSYPPGNATQFLSKSYSPSDNGNGTRIMKFMTRQYFIATGTSGNPALFRRDNASAAQELVDGIEDLQVLYGKNTDGVTPGRKPNIYLKAGAPGLQTQAEWSAVVAVRIGVLARTVNNKDSSVDNGVYDVDGDCPAGAAGTDPCYEFTAPGDHNKRRVFQATVLLRNLQ